MRWFELSLPPQPAVIGIARTTAAATARLAMLDPEVADDARTCISEAVTNAVNAHTREGLATPVLVRLGADDGLLILEVHDRGTGPTPPVTTMVPVTDVDELTEGGFGIPVMEALADDFELTSGEDGGTIVTLRFRH